MAKGLGLMSDWKPYFDKEVDTKELNIILSPGRVATTSLHEWINRSGIKIYKTHEIDRKSMGHLRAERKVAGLPIPHFEKQAYHITGRAIKIADPVRLVLPVREPLSRNLSAFRRFVSNGVVTLPRQAQLSQLAELFYTSVPPDRLDRWVSRVLLPLIPEAQLRNRLSKDQHAVSFDYKRFKILLIRAELSDFQKHRHLSAFFNHKIVTGNRIETAKSHNQNLSDAHIDMLKELKKNVPNAYIRTLRGSLYNRLFYPELSV